MPAPRPSQRRILACFLLCGATASAVAALRPPPAGLLPSGLAAAPDRRVDRDTRFQYVAVFPPGTGSGEIEAWRRQVLVRSHRAPCFHGWPCLARLLRLSEQGPTGVELLAFDLQADAPPRERAAVLAAARRTAPRPTLYADASPAQVAAGALQPLPTPEDTFR
ncbi:MAG: hypothetical protein KF823_15010 [Xanthomonadales bacterium]|nr:hypothetical protein [Xanthomonadales bacterium]